MIFSYILTLLGVCGLAVGSLVLLRAAKGGGLSFSAAQPIRILGRQVVGTGSTLVLVELEGERLLIGVSRGGIAVLESSKKNRNAEPVEARSGARTTLRQAQDYGGASFRATLRRAGERW